MRKGHHGTTVCGLEDGHFIESLSTKPIVCLNPLKSTRQYGFPPQQLNERSGSGKSNGGDRSCSHPVFLFVGMTCSRYKGPLVYITAIRVLEIVQYAFVNPHGSSGGHVNLYFVVIISILCFAFCCPVLWALYCVIIHRDQI